MVTYSGGTPIKSILINWKFYRKRPLCKATYNENPSPLFKRSKITKFKDIHSSQLGQLMYDLVNNNLPPPLMDLYIYWWTHLHKYGDTDYVSVFTRERAYYYYYYYYYTIH